MNRLSAKKKNRQPLAKAGLIKQGLGESRNTLALYLKEINRIPLLSRSEEDECVRLAINGDEKAKKKLIRGNLRFVVNVAKRYQGQGLPLADLVSEGNIGLINALKRYDPDKGFHFISYAVWWIKQAILKAIYEKSRMIRLPLNRANELAQISKVRKEMQGYKGKDPTVAEISAQVNLEKELVSDLLKISRDLVSLEAPVFFSENESLQVSDFIMDKKLKRPEEVTVNESLSRQIEDLLTILSKKEADIIRCRYGLNGLRPHSLKEIGEKYSLTKERIRQIELSAIKKLEQPSLDRQLDVYVGN